MNNTRITVMGVPVDNIDMQGAVDSAAGIISQGLQCTIYAMNPEKAMAARDNKKLYECLASADLLIADGIGIVVASRLQKVDFKERVPGSELMPKLCEMAAERGHGIFLFGASEEVNKLAAENLKQKYPKINIAGRNNGYVTENEMPDLINKINQSDAKLLFVALGSPKQEYWMEAYRSQLNVSVLQGVGGTFDVLSGCVRRAPVLWRTMHLEWMYRLLTQPKRFLRQSRLPAYAWLVLLNWLGLKKV